MTSHNSSSSFNNPLKQRPGASSKVVFFNNNNASTQAKKTLDDAMSVSSYLQGEVSFGAPEKHNWKEINLLA